MFIKQPPLNAGSDVMTTVIYGDFRLEFNKFSCLIIKDNLSFSSDSSYGSANRLLSIALKSRTKTL